jgi:hypothetical protein
VEFDQLWLLWDKAQRNPPLVRDYHRRDAALATGMAANLFTPRGEATERRCP